MPSIETELQQTIVIVDDVPENIKILHNLLKDLAKIYFTTDSTKVLEFAEEYQPDLILLDINMPHFDGYEVCRQLKVSEKTKNTAIIFITARTSTEDEAKGLSAGAIDYITKPFPSAVVRCRIKNQLESQAIRSQLLEANKQLAQQANIDSLTGAYNRRFFDSTLGSQINNCKRYELPLSIIIIDLDFFKNINDVHGHSVGDDVLKHCAKIFMQHIREGDFLCRIGGEEFCLILPNTNLQNTQALAERIRIYVANTNFTTFTIDNASLKVTISQGLAELKDSDALELYINADEALYEAKNNGRNCTRSAI